MPEHFAARELCPGDLSYALPCRGGFRFSFFTVIPGTHAEAEPLQVLLSSV